MTFEVDLPPLGELSSGDRVRVEFDGCTDGENTLQGAMVYSFESVTGDTSAGGSWSSLSTPNMALQPTTSQDASSATRSG